MGGKRSALAALNARLGQLPIEERKEAGRAINAARSRVEAAIAERAEKLAAAEREAGSKPSGSTSPRSSSAGGPPRGHRHLVTQARDELEDLFVAMGYEVAEGPEVETDWYNFEALNMPPGPSGPQHVGHPVREARAKPSHRCCAPTRRRCRSGSCRARRRRSTS